MGHHSPSIPYRSIYISLFGITEMNERIKELAEQARVKSHWSIDEARYLVNYLNEEKFAELIVKECAEIADTADATREKWQSIGKFVREHFGVEE
jgi:hypothetical protein